jgi:hypothetical protein
VLLLTEKRKFIIMKMQKILIPVELSGGPLDGHRDDVEKGVIDELDVHLFELRTGQERLRCAYAWGDRTANKGRRWVLVFQCVVSRFVVKG